MENTRISNIKYIRSDYTISYGETYIAVDASKGRIRVTLPEAVEILNCVFKIKKVDTSDNMVIVLPIKDQSIDGSSNYLLDVPMETVDLIPLNNNWYVF